MRSSLLCWLAVIAAVIGLATLENPAPAADTPHAGMWKLVVTSMPEGVDHTMFLVKIDIKGGKPKGFMLSSPVEKYENAVLDDVTIDGKKITLVINTGDKKMPLVMFAPEDDPAPVRLLGSCEIDRQRLFARAERTKEFSLTKEKAETPMPGIVELRQAQKSGFSTEKEAMLRELISKYGDLPVSYYAYLQLVNVLATNGSPDADVKAAIDKAVKLAERYDPTMKPTVLTTAAFAEIAGLRTRAELLRKSKKEDEAKAVETRVATLEKSVLDDELKASIPYTAKPFAGRKAQSDRVVVLELFTGTACPPCVAAVTAYDGLVLTYKPTDVVLLQYHLNVPAPDPLTHKDCEKRAEYYEVQGTPTFYLNGKTGPAVGGPKNLGASGYATLTAALNEALETQSSSKLTLKATRQDDKIDIQADYSDLKVANKDVRMKFVVVEELARYTGPNGQQFHHHVVRGMPGGVEGVSLTEVKGQQTAKANLTELTKDLKEYVDEFRNRGGFKPDDKPFELSKLKVVALIQNDKTKEIYQAAQVELADPK